MTARLHDVDAETSVAGCAIATRHGARLAAGRRLDPADLDAARAAIAAARLTTDHLPQENP